VIDNAGTILSSAYGNLGGNDRVVDVQWHDSRSFLTVATVEESRSSLVLINGHVSDFDSALYSATSLPFFPGVQSLEHRMEVQNDAVTSSITCSFRGLTFYACE
jgi:hypothetical protein